MDTPAGEPVVVVTVELSAVLDYYGVRFSPARTSQKVCCPIHGERDPSMSVNLEKNAFKCHACGAQGGPLQFIQQKEGIDYVAARAFARSHGLDDGDAVGGEVDDRPAWARAGSPRIGAKPRQSDGGYTPPWLRL